MLLTSLAKSATLITTTRILINNSLSLSLLTADETRSSLRLTLSVFRESSNLFKTRLHSRIMASMGFGSQTRHFQLSALSISLNLSRPKFRFKHDLWINGTRSYASVIFLNRCLLRVELAVMRLCNYEQCLIFKLVESDSLCGIG